MKMEEIEQNINSLDGLSMLVYLTILENLDENEFEEEYKERFKKHIFKKIINGENIELEIKTNTDI